MRILRPALVAFILAIYLVPSAQAATIYVQSGTVDLFNESGAPLGQKAGAGAAIELPASVQLRTSAIQSDLSFWSQTTSSKDAKFSGAGTYVKVKANGQDAWINVNLLSTVQLSKTPTAVATGPTPRAVPAASSSNNAASEAGICPPGVDCPNRRAESPGLFSRIFGGGKSTGVTSVTMQTPPKAKMPGIAYDTFPACYGFIDQNGNYGDYGKWAEEELKRYPHILFSQQTSQIMSGSRNSCSGFAHMTQEQKIHYFVAVVQNIAAYESRCQPGGSSPGSINPSGTAAVGLMQLDNDYARDMKTKGNPRLLDQQNIRTSNTTGVADTCVDRSFAADWPSGYPRIGTQSLHNPRFNIRCGVGILMRMLAEGNNPAHGGYFGPLNGNIHVEGLPYANALDVFSQHPLCSGFSS